MRAIFFEVVVTALLSSVAFGARAPQDPDEPVRDGKWLYTRNCAGCHNDNGDGKGATILQMGLTARDFKQGGFAFGDTPEQLAKTISTGIPGRSPMPSFKGTLSEDEIKLVVEYVQTLMPPRKDEKPKNTVMVVKDRPVIARGKLPPIAEGAKEIPRGLLIGTPEGMTFEYDLDDVKLVGVRLGGFADRTDWRDRGGGYLEPLGKLIWSAQSVAGDVKLSLQTTRTFKQRRVLKSTWTRGSTTGLTYDIVSDIGTGQVLATVQEAVRAETGSAGPGFTREWRCVRDPGLSVALEYTIDRGDQAGAESVGQLWAIRPIDQEGVDATYCSLELKKDFHARVTTLRVPKWDTEVALKLKKELGL